ncbi:MAG: Rab GDP-dissociation inhibitor [Amphiamblys sp. WSBS2006]|nr:MAG: Rab GDP-dissociation inhibitor [Amphiamblys sp. WSBS2006]
MGGFMDDHYDYLILGTGITECIMGGILSMQGSRVLQVDRNKHYGGECASLDLQQLYARFGETTEDESFRKYCIDLVPKFIMAQGDLIEILAKTKATSYIDFQTIKGSYVYRNGRISKIPSAKIDTLKSPLLGIFEKKRVWSFFNLARDSPDGASSYYDTEKMTAEEIYSEYYLGKETREFIGHAVALFSDDSYLTQPAKNLLKRIRLYMFSISKYGHSPYIYPLYGLGELPQAFARLGAIHNAVYMLGKKVDGLYREGGEFKGVVIDSTPVSCSAVIASPEYLPEKCSSAGMVARAICILGKPLHKKGAIDSGQIIIPQKQVGRKNDIYIALLSQEHRASPPGKWIAIASTVMETDNAEEELKPAFSLLGEIDKKFVSASEMYVPEASKKEKNIFVSRSMDASSHFEGVCEDVHRLYKEITGKDIRTFLDGTDR